jgi:cell division protein FtsB
MAGTGRKSGRPAGAAGRAPRSGRRGAAQQRRSRAAPPSRARDTTSPRLGRANLTARAAILAVAVASVALAVALPFKVWVGQRGQIHSLQAQTTNQEQQVAKLRQEQQRWADPAYVKQQARLRLHYAMPGETTYIVLGKAKPHAAHAAKGPAKTILTGPWYSRLWTSVEVAGATPKS